MEIGHWMTRRVHSVKPRDSIRHAREIMERHRVNQLPVVVNGELVGVITDRDLRDAYPSVFAPSRPPKRGRKQIPPSADPNDIPVDAVMTPHVLTLSSKDSVEAGARLMRTERIGSVPIVDDGRLVGILTRSDVLEAFVAMSEALNAPVAGESARPAAGGGGESVRPRSRS